MENETISTSACACLHPLNVDIVSSRANIYPFKKKGRQHSELQNLKYRSVCHTWNDIIVEILNKSVESFKIPLRFGPQVPRSIMQSDALCFAEETLKNTIKVLTGSAGRLVFDTVVIHGDFYLAGVMPEWINFLSIQGKSIRHLQLEIRSADWRDWPEHFVSQVQVHCEEVVSVENVRAIFFSTPNLVSLHFGVGFSNYLAQSRGQANSTNFSLFAPDDIPKLQKLTKITIQEPRALSVLNIEPIDYLQEFTTAIKSLESQLKESLTSRLQECKHLRRLPAPFESYTGHFLPAVDHTGINIYRDARTGWLDALLQSQHSTLVTLILGEHNKSRWFREILDSFKLLTFPPVMESLKRLEVNLTKLKHLYIPSYKDRFPVLEFLLFTCWQRENENAELLQHLMKLLTGVPGQSHTIKEFSLIGPIWPENNRKIVQRAHETFPLAKCHFKI